MSSHSQHMNLLVWTRGGLHHVAKISIKAANQAVTVNPDSFIIPSPAFDLCECVCHLTVRLIVYKMFQAETNPENHPSSNMFSKCYKCKQYVWEHVYFLDDSCDMFCTLFINWYVLDYISIVIHGYLPGFCNLDNGTPAVLPKRVNEIKHIISLCLFVLLKTVRFSRNKAKVLKINGLFRKAVFVLQNQ